LLNFACLKACPPSPFLFFLFFFLKRKETKEKRIQGDKRDLQKKNKSFRIKTLSIMGGREWDLL